MSPSLAVGLTDALKGDGAHGSEGSEVGRDAVGYGDAQVDGTQLSSA